MHSELIEWQVVHRVGREVHLVTDGAQSVFALSTARKLVKRLGVGYSIRHVRTGRPPDAIDLKETADASTGST